MENVSFNGLVYKMIRCCVCDSGHRIESCFRVLCELLKRIFENNLECFACKISVGFSLYKKWLYVKLAIYTEVKYYFDI